MTNAGVKHFSHRLPEFDSATHIWTLCVISDVPSVLPTLQLLYITGRIQNVLIY